MAKGVRNWISDWRHGSSLYRVSDLRSVCADNLHRMPYVLRILLENALREAGTETAREARANIMAWLNRRTSDHEIVFRPRRLLMHDTTCVPALVDVAALRSVLHESGRDPRSLNPVLPVDVSVDHSLSVDYFAVPNAPALNMANEINRNAERFAFLKWVGQTLSGITVHPPGTGIMHTMNLEQLSTVAQIIKIDGNAWVVPDTVLGTDSHTPMVNGLGVLGWGIGGLEAEGVMFGIPACIRIPNVVGVRLTGRLPEGVLATDLALYVTEQLRQFDLADTFVEFFGPGVSTLTVSERSVVANMAPEYGATTGYFPIDAMVSRYLVETGRSPNHAAFVEAFARYTGLWFDPEARPAYTEQLDFDLSRIAASVAGPRRPQDRHSAGDTRSAMSAAIGKESLPEELPRLPVAIAAITSCTNTSDPRLLLAAGLLARKARALGLSPKLWVKTSLAPGSPAAAKFLSRAGVLEDLDALGFSIVGYGCTTCIGNSGRLTDRIIAAVDTCRPVAVISGNRNFPGRIHPNLEDGFLASPPLVVAFALAGDVDRDILVDPIGIRPDGRPVHLSEIWPSSDEIDALLRSSSNPKDYPAAFLSASINEQWGRLAAPESATFPWNPDSTYIRRPPFVKSCPENSDVISGAAPLVVLGDDITTDHISPAGAIPADSEAGRHLIQCGENPSDLNVFAARRGNWEVMLRGILTNSTVHNLLGTGIPPGYTIHGPSGKVLPIWKAAECFRNEGIPLVIFAGERYGMGSSRDWAAKGLALLGVKAVLSTSFERIHRTNLIGMGILPLRLPAEQHPETLCLSPHDRISIQADIHQIKPRSQVSVSIRRASGRENHLMVRLAVETSLESELLQAGGMLPFILEDASRSQRNPDSDFRRKERSDAYP